MGFTTQLKLLLWKNLTLKKRKPHVLVFELFIPLVLFFILLIIRRNQPSQRIGDLSFSARPLPSSGLMAVLQSFCDGGVKDEDGFDTFPNSTLDKFLSNLNDIARKRNFVIRPGFEPKELESIPKIYRSIMEDPIAIHSLFLRTGDFQVKDLFKDHQNFSQYLKSTEYLALSDSQVEALFETGLDMKKVHDILFGIESLIPNGQPFSLFDFLKQKDLKNSKIFMAFAWIFDVYSKGELTVDIDSFAKEAVDILITKESVKAFFCQNNTIPYISPIFMPNNSYKNDFNTIPDQICSNLSDTHLTELTTKIRQNFNDSKVYDILNRDWDYRRAKKRINQFFEDLNKFALFELTLEELSQIAVSLPNDVCKPIDTNHTSNDTSDKHLVHLSQDINDMTNNSLKNDNQSKPFDSNSHRKKNNVEGLVRVFLKMQETICGPKVENKIEKTNISKKRDNKNETVVEEKPDEDSDEEPVNQFIKEQSLLLNMLYSNPTILFAPNKTGSAAHQIIQKANQTFELLDKITNYAHILLNISQDLKDYLNQEQTQRQFHTVKEIRKNILHLPKIFRFLEFGHGLELLNKSISIGGDLDTFKAQLNVIYNAACSWLTLTKDISLNVFRGFASEKDLLNYFQKKAWFDNVTVIASVIFELNPNSSSLPPHITYKIRQNASFTSTTAMVRNRFWFPGPKNWGYYYYQFGFVWIQDILERAMISLHANEPVTNPGTYLHQFPYPCHISDQFLFIIEHVMPLCMAISWVYSVSMLVQSIVYEKEQRLKEVMKTMGLNSLVHWMAWFMTAFLQMSITAILLTIILKYGLVLTYSNPFLVFLYIEIFVIANIVFSFLVSVLYSKAKLAAACAGIIYFLTYVPCMYLAVREETAHDKIPFYAKTLASLLSTTAFGMGAKYFAFYEEVGVGVQWSNIAVSPVEDDSFTLWNVMNMMVLDALMYATLVWYIENVHPGTYGLPRPWYFPFTKSYWLGTPIGVDDLFCSLNFAKKKLNSDQKKRSRPPSESINLNDLIYFEAEPINLNLGVSILNLVKRYQKGAVPAVNKLSVNLYEGQITTFLGHNGAGKTTTMSILTGLFPPTSGETHIYGLDIKTDMDVIRQSMGICPQHNVLFDELTVEEHLWFYSCLKDVKGGNKLEDDITKLISDLSLPIKRGKTVESLSGGMKRKLSVAIAFIGDSKVVILDEPTAGVDPYTRRAIWDLILKYKKNRTILLSTHHMDEADVLSDRIAILSNGQIKCCGSPLFLKHNLGEGYHLIFVKNNHYKTHYRSDIEVPSLEVQLFVQTYVPTAKYLFETQQEIHFILPNIELKNFVRLFTALENPQNLLKLNVSTFGLKNTTLEEIFLKVASNWNFNILKTTFQQNHRRQHSWDRPSTSASMNSRADFSMGYKIENREHIDLKMPTEKVESKKRLLFNQFSAILFKRWCCTKRNWKGLFSQILLPAFFVCVAMSVALIAPKSQDMPPLVLSPAQYYNFTQNLGGNVIPYCERQYQLKGNNSQNISSTFHLPSGVGATCLLMSQNLIPNNYSELSVYDLVSNYLKLDSACTSVLVPGIKPRIFLPMAPTSSAYTYLFEEDITESMPTSEYLKYFPNCQCRTDGTGYICDSSGFQTPPSLNLITGDVLIDITGVGLGDREHLYYLTTTDMYRLRRYGAFTFGLTRDYIPEDFAQKVSAQQSTILRQIAVRNVSKVWFNNKGFHSMPTYLNALNNAILRSVLKKSKGNPAAFGITLINHPMVDTSYAISQEQILQGTDVLIAIFIIVAMSFVPASFVLFLVYERFTKAKHLQFVSGVNAIVYWTANYFWDMCSYVVPAMCCILILLIFDIPAYTSKNNFPAVVSLFLMYGWSVTPVMYPVSFLFEEPSTAYICLIVLNLFVGITCIVTSFLLEAFLYMSYVPYLAHIHKILKACFLMFPNYCLGRGLMDVAFNEYQNFYLFKTGQYSKMKSPFAWDLVTRNLIAMALSGFVFFIITLLCEFNVFRCLVRKKKVKDYRSSTPTEEDSDVTQERERVLTTPASNDTVLRLTNLTKVFKKPQKHLAVNQLCLDVTKGECFGLLGVNGAGKSTTFKMLTGDIPISSGDALLNQMSAKTDLLKAQKHIGYCPQFDALFDELTAREHLKFYARLRGVKAEEQAIETVLKRLELTQFADQVTRTYSGGTKRKLSAAIALISSPPLVFMDEPTTGMDPYTRRFLWDLILELVHNDRISVVLTSHSMEECEALCSRVAILVNGRFTCLGSIQHLKNRFGDGYHIIARCDPNQSSEKTIEWFSKNLPNAVLRENNFNILQFEIRRNQSSMGSVNNSGHPFSLSDIFDKLQKSGISEYTVCQNTLDNLFVNLAKKQKSGGHFILSSKLKTKSNKKLLNNLDVSLTADLKEDTPEPSLTHSRISLTEFGGGTSSTSSTVTNQS